MVRAYYGRMADFSQILATRPDFDDRDREWLHHLVADWQVVADLSFADLLLLIKNGEGRYVVAEQCRPSTMVTLRADDIVGKVVPEDQTAELDAAMERLRAGLVEDGWGEFVPAQMDSAALA